MRNPERLNQLYADIKLCHKELPDWRFTQLMINFFDWHRANYGTDGFYVEDDDFIDKFREFVDSMFVHSVPQ